jgi:hypothetical protein
MAFKAPPHVCQLRLGLVTQSFKAEQQLCPTKKAKIFVLRPSATGISKFAFTGSLALYHYSLCLS